MGGINHLMSFSLTKLAMIKKRHEFLAVKSGASKVGSSSGSSFGNSWGTAGFLLQACVREDQKNLQEDKRSEARFGVTVTNNTIRKMISAPQKGKNPKKANEKRGPVSVLRNKMRRRLKEALRQIAPELARPGVDYVIIGRQACLSIDYADLLKDLEKSFKKVHRRIISSGTD